MSNDNGQRFYLPIEAKSRPDLAEHFGKAALVNSGFKVIANTSDIKGKYFVGLAIEGKGKLRQCSNYAQPVVLP